MKYNFPNKISTTKQIIQSQNIIQYTKNNIDIERDLPLPRIEIRHKTPVINENIFPQRIIRNYYTLSPDNKC